MVGHENCSCYYCRLKYTRTPTIKTTLVYHTMWLQWEHGTTTRRETTPSLLICFRWELHTLTLPNMWFVQGQFRSIVTCLTCRKQSVTFEVFMYLTVPIPSTGTRPTVEVELSLYFLYCLLFCNIRIVLNCSQNQKRWKDQISGEWICIKLLFQIRSAKQQDVS